MVSNLDVSNALADGLDNSTSLVTKYDRERAFRIITRQLAGCTHQQTRFSQQALTIQGLRLILDHSRSPANPLFRS